MGCGPNVEVKGTAEDVGCSWEYAGETHKESTRMAARVATVAKAVLALGLTGVSLSAALGHDPIDVNANVFPWSSVGKIYNSARSSCTGSLIAPDKSLTAAHCLFNRATHRFLQQSPYIFCLVTREGSIAPMCMSRGT